MHMRILYFLVFLNYAHLGYFQPLTLQTLTIEQFLSGSADTSNYNSNNVPLSQAPQILGSSLGQTFSNDQFMINFNNGLNFAPSSMEMDSKMKCSKKIETSSNVSPNMISLDSITLTYSQYLQNFKKIAQCSLTNEQKFFRAEVYKQNLKKINFHNSQENRKYTMGLNQFTDLLQQQFLQSYARLTVPQYLVDQANKINEKPIPNTFPRIVVDWQCHSKRIVDQGKCGASHVISALETIQIGLKNYGQLQNTQFDNLAIQDVLSCGSDKKYPDLQRCNGGFFQGVFQYVRDEEIGKSTFYPYSLQSLYAGVAPPCDINLRKSPSYLINMEQIVSYQKIQPNNCLNLLQSLEFRPIAAAIYAKNLQFYREGVFTTQIPKPYTQKGWQGVTILGYDPNNKFKIKNSWGPTWGIRGFGYADQSSGLCKFASYPITGLQLDLSISPTCCQPISLLSLI